MIINRERLYYFFYAFLSFAIVIIPGDIDKQFFTLDSPIGPNIYKGLLQSFYGFEAPVWGGHLLWKLFYTLLTALFSAPVMQRILIFLILFIAGFSAHRSAPVDSHAAKLFAGVLYMLNPYTYTRIIVGHWLILISYAVLPLALKSFIALLEKRGRRETISFVILLTLVGLNSHTLLLAFIAMGVIFLVWFMKTRDITVLKTVAFAGALFILLNSFWLIPVATSRNTIVSNIGSEDIEVYAPQTDSFSALFTLASMYGFWREGYVYAKDFLPFWQVLFVIILFFSVHGFTSYFRNEKIWIYAQSFALIAVISLLLAAGIQSPFSEAFRWLFDSTPLKGMRDSHKFVTLLVLAYAYLGALCVQDFSNEIKNRDNRKKYLYFLVVALALATPFIYSFTFFNGFAGQIKPADYPKDWYEVNDFLDSDAQDFKVLFFPWHQYMDFHWVPNNDKRIGNPAQHFFNKEIISGKNVEIGTIYRQIDPTDQLYIDSLLREGRNITNFGNLIAPLDVKYILLTKEVDYKKYFFLFNQTDLELVKETENFYVFRNQHEVAKIYQVDSIMYLKNWNELLERSRSEDTMQSLYLIGNASNEAPGLPGKRELRYVKKSPVEYELKENTSTGYIVFTEPYSESWELDGKKPAAAYGVVNAYEGGGQGIRYERYYRVYVPAYIISFVILIALLAVYKRVRWNMLKKREK